MFSDRSGRSIDPGKQEGGSDDAEHRQRGWISGGCSARSRARSCGTSDARYDEARRVWNAMIDKRPAVIVRPLDAEDVASSVRFAAKRICRSPFAAEVTASPGRASATTGC